MHHTIRDRFNLLSSCIIDPTLNNSGRRTCKGASPDLFFPKGYSCVAVARTTMTEVNYEQ
jgi:hypothetical protein